MVERFRFVLAIILLGFFLFSSIATATPMTPSYQGLSITPAIEQITISKSQPTKTFRIRIDNNQDTSVTLNISSLDFKSLNESGGLAFIDTSSSASLQNKYGLAKWLSLPTNKIVLAPNSGRFISFSVRNDSSLSPGGHYGAILFQATSPNRTSLNNIQSNPVVSSLIFLRKTGGEIYSINLSRASLNRAYGWFGWPSSISLLFTNTGNIQTAPEGALILGGTTKPVNINSSLVLPESSRMFNESLYTKRPFLPGLYHYKLTYHPDLGGSSKSYTISFVYIGWPFLLALLFILVVLLIGVKKFRNRSKAA